MRKAGVKIRCSDVAAAASSARASARGLLRRKRYAHDGHAPRRPHPVHRRRGDRHRQARRAAGRCAARAAATASSGASTNSCCGFKRPPTPMHRLDQDTSGCLLFARNPKRARRVPAGVRGGHGREISISPCSAASSRRTRGVIDLPLGKMSSAEAGWRMVARLRQRGKPALTRWRRLGRARRPDAGRVQPADRPHPPDPRPRARGARRAGSSATASTAIPGGDDAAPRLAAGGAARTPSRRSTSPRRCPSFRRVGSTHRRCRLTIAARGRAEREVPRRDRPRRAERQQGRDRVPAALRRVQARPQPRRLRAAEDDRRKQADQRRRAAHHRAPLPHAGGQSRRMRARGWRK